MIAALPLNEFVGRSPLNVRTDEEAGDVAGMAASFVAIGMLHPIIIRDDGRGWEVLDGGRRLAAWRALRDALRVAPDIKVAVSVDTRSEAEAREASLAANVIRQALHPVEEFEAFARLVHDGFSVDRIAADFQLTTRFVKQRLVLDKLSPEVREAWRSGRITADVAEAFTLGSTHAAQDSVVADRSLGDLTFVRAETIRALFTRNVTNANAPEARYVGLDAYAAAGGEIDDNLFGEFSLCLDGSLLKRLARAKMTAEGEALLERTALGFLAFRADVEAPWTWTRLPSDVTQADANRLAEIEADEAAIIERTGGLPEGEAAAAIRTERFEIELRGMMRGSRVAARATAGILLSLTSEGWLEAEIGLVPPKADRSERVANPRVAAPPPEPDPIPPADKADDEKKPLKAVIDCLDQARDAAWRGLIAERPTLALLLATAVLAAGTNFSPLRFRAFVRQSETPAIDSFAGTLAQLLGAGNRVLEELQARFARAVGATVLMNSNSKTGQTDPSGITRPEDTTAFAETIAAFCAGDTYATAMRNALDYEAYFKAATRDAAISTVTEVGGDVNHARTLKKGELAAFAAGLAQDRGWLPRELRRPEALPVDHPHATPTLTLAEAMATALADDGAYSEEAAEADELDAVPGVYTVVAFLDEACASEPEAAVKAADLFAAYTARLGDRAAEVDSVEAFTAAVQVIDPVETKRRKGGLLILGLRLTEEREAA